MIKPEKNRRKFKVLITALVILALAGLVLSMQIRTVTVTGNKYYTEDQVTGMLFKDKWSRLAIVCYLKDHFKEHEKIPFVEDYKISFKNPLSVEVMLYEKSIVGYVTYMSSFMYFDKDGIIVESANEQLDGIPWITGLKFGHIVLHERLPVEDPKVFDSILNLTQVLAYYGIGVDKIQYDSGREATLYLGKIEVELGDSSDIDGKISVLNDILRDIPDLKNTPGILSLDTYDDTNGNLSYSFKRK